VAAAETDRFTLDYLAKASERPGYGSTDTWWIDAGFIRELRAGLKEEDYR
jgi:hypothetical protein